MVRIAIDIPVHADVQSALDLPPCLALPKLKPLKVTLPTGGSMQAMADVSAGVPTDCALSLNLMLQVAPLLASIECPLKMLKVIGPLVEVVTGLAKAPPEPPGPDLIQKLLKAVEELQPCLGIVIPGGSMLDFVKSLLCLIRRILNCLLGQLRSVRDLLFGLQLSLANAEGNADLLTQLDCAKEDADAAMANVMHAIEPIGAVLALMSPMFEIAGQEPLKLEMPGTGPADAEALTAIVDTLQALVDAIDDVTGGICE